MSQKEKKRAALEVALATANSARAGIWQKLPPAQCEALEEVWEGHESEGLFPEHAVPMSVWKEFAHSVRELLGGNSGEEDGISWLEVSVSQEDMPEKIRFWAVAA